MAGIYRLRVVISAAIWAGYGFWVKITADKNSKVISLRTEPPGKGIVITGQGI
jgi:hypothetical protein